MSKENFSLRNYLQLIDFEENNLEQNEFEDNLNLTNIKPYPFTKNELIEYLLTDQFFSSIINKDEINKKNDLLNFYDSIELRKILDNIPIEKKLENVKKEKCRRYQAYKLLEYNLSHFTYFDFFSLDTFQIAKNSKYITQIYNQDQVSFEFLLLPFFDLKLEIGNLLNSFGFNESFLEKILTRNFVEKSKTNSFLLDGNINFINLKKKIKNFFEELFFINKSFFNKLKIEFSFDQQIIYSYQIHQIFEKSTENALNRFRTPIVTPEILFITLMEQKNLSISKLIKKNLSDETAWYLLRYRLLKLLYYQEIDIKTQVPKNLYFFAYLLKTQISESHFQKLIQKKVLSKAVLLFRNIVISELLKYDLIKNFDQETYSSISISPKRYYT
jgi:hypothetical protein